MGSAAPEGSLRAWLDYGVRYLEGRGVADARTDAWILLEHAANISRSFYYMHMHELLDESDAVEYRRLLAGRGKRIPVQYLTGEAWFYGHCFRVNSHVLIPRQDTEVLVEEALKRIVPGMKVLDLCTGSGCILISILKAASVTGIGADISPEALEMAAKNAKSLGVRAVWAESDLFRNIGGTFHMIVSNPPYIPAEVIEGLEPEVRDHEPRTALDGGADGLSFYRRIVREAGDYLEDGGWLCLEIGYDQGEDLRKMMAEAGYEDVEIIRDLAGLDRVAAGRLEKGRTEGRTSMCGA